MVGFGCEDVVLLEPWLVLDELDDDESCASATVPSISTAGGNTIHFESLLLITFLLLLILDVIPWAACNTQVWGKSCERLYWPEGQFGAFGNSFPLPFRHTKLAVANTFRKKEVSFRGRFLPEESAVQYWQKQRIPRVARNDRIFSCGGSEEMLLREMQITRTFRSLQWSSRSRRMRSWR